MKWAYLKYPDLCLPKASPERSAEDYIVYTPPHWKQVLYRSAYAPVSDTSVKIANNSE